VRVAAHVVGVRPTRLEQLDDARLVLGASLRQLVDRQRLADDRADRHARVERRVGILEDDLHVARQGAQLVLAGAVTSLPSNQTSPEVGSIRRRMQRPVVLLPQPDSPTRPSVSPAIRSKLTPLTAWTLSTSRPSQPPVIEALDQVLHPQQRRRHAHPLAARQDVEDAAHLVARRRLAQRRRRRDAFGHRVLAARRRSGSLRPVDQLRHGAWNLLETHLVQRRGVDARDRADHPCV
jgi:hypothetical protein